MDKDETINSYYRDTIEKLVEKYKVVIEECLKIIGEPLDKDLKDDKLQAALKGKRQASEDAEYYAREIDKKLAELEGKEIKDETKDETQKVTWVKKQAR